TPSRRSTRTTAPGWSGPATGRRVRPSGRSWPTSWPTGWPRLELRVVLPLPAPRDDLAHERAKHGGDDDHVDQPRVPREEDVVHLHAAAVLQREEDQEDDPDRGDDRPR